MMKVCSVIGLIQNYLNSHSSSGSQSTLFPHKLLHKHWDLRSSLHSKCMHAQVKLWWENKEYFVFLFFIIQ